MFYRRGSSGERRWHCARSGKKEEMEGREEKQERKGGRVTVGSQRPPKSASVSRLFMCLQGDGEGTVKH